MGLIVLGLGACIPVKANVQVGTASWYGPGFNGKPTASGVIYDQKSNCAASKTIPLGTIITITNLDNGKKVKSVVLDRGPYVANRILDMSQGLKNSLGCSDLCRVRIVS